MSYAKILSKDYNLNLVLISRTRQKLEKLKNELLEENSKNSTALSFRFNNNFQNSFMITKSLSAELLSDEKFYDAVM